jgi:hypothetical protein
MIIFNLLFILTFLAKGIIHVFIAYKNNNQIAAAGAAGASIELFWFYLKPVSIEYMRLKKICNLLHLYNLLFLIKMCIQIVIK